MISITLLLLAVKNTAVVAVTDEVGVTDEVAVTDECAIAAEVKNKIMRSVQLVQHSLSYTYLMMGGSDGVQLWLFLQLVVH